MLLAAMAALTASIGCAQAQTPAPPPAGACENIRASVDPAIARNAAALASADLCVRTLRFVEAGLNWTLRSVESQRPGPLWVAPHDNEAAAFDSAVYAVAAYGGRAVSVANGGQRNNGAQDPNRNFGVGTGCPVSRALATRFVGAVLGDTPRGGLIIALHSNDVGYGGDGAGGQGHISIRRPASGVTAFAAGDFPGAASPSDTMVITAGLGAAPDAAQTSVIAALNARNVNVLYEHVTPANFDCSMSNYVATERLGRYFNVEVVHGDAATQQRLIDLLLQVLRR